MKDKTKSSTLETLSIAITFKLWVKPWPAKLAFEVEIPSEAAFFSTVDGLPWYSDIYYHPSVGLI